MSDGFAVWAPAARRVDLHLVAGAVPMEPVDGGWWRADRAATHGTRYAFSVDGGAPRPDPRSRRQPDGVHGWSEVVDPSGFRWHDEGWNGRPLTGSVIYELHVGTFTAEGTLDAAASRLGHLVDLGVDVVELMPLAAFPGRWGWGYDGVAISAVHEPYGGPEALARFVDAAHAAGLAVLLDVVHNHLGPDGNHLGLFGPYFSDRHVTDWGAAVNLDGPGSDEVRAWIVDSCLWWLRDLHLDGLRLDAVHALVDTSARHLLEQLSEEVDALAADLGRTSVLVAESDRNDPWYVRSREDHGAGMDAAWADDWHHALHAVLTGEGDGYYVDFGSLAQLGKALRQAWVLDGTYSTHRGRVHGRTTQGISTDRFVVCTQNHDQVGNRAAGERLAALTTPARLRVAATLLCTTPFTPMLFQGEEWGASTPFPYFTDHTDAELGRAVTEGRRREFAAFGWDPGSVPDPQDPTTRASAVLRWDELDDAEHASLLAWYRELLALRRREPAFVDPRPGITGSEVDEDAGWLRVRRPGLEVVAHLGTAEAAVAVPAGASILAASDRGIRLDDGGLHLPPDTAAVLRVPDPPGR